MSLPDVFESTIDSNKILVPSIFVSTKGWTEFIERST